MIAEFVSLISTQREVWDRETAPLRQRLARQTADIKDAKENLNRIEQQPEIEPKTTTNGVDDTKNEAWRRKNKLEKERERLARARVRYQQLDADIASRHNQLLDRQNQIVAYTWLRIETYLGVLVRAHPDGDRLNAVINEWAITELADTVAKFTKLDEKLIERDQQRKAIEPPERD